MKYEVVFESFTVVKLQVMEKFLERKYVYCTREFRQFAEENARKNVQSEVRMLKGRAEHLSTCKLRKHTCRKEDEETAQENRTGEQEPHSELCSQD